MSLQEKSMDEPQTDQVYADPMPTKLDGYSNHSHGTLGSNPKQKAVQESRLTRMAEAIQMQFEQVNRLRGTVAETYIQLGGEIPVPDNPDKEQILAVGGGQQGMVEETIVRLSNALASLTEEVNNLTRTL